MSLAYTNDENSVWSKRYGELTTQQKIDKAEKRLKDKKNLIEDLQNELRLLEADAFLIYKQEVIYNKIWPNIIDDASKWLAMLNKGEKIDKRKKCKEKDMFQYLTKTLQDIFGQPDIEIYEFIIEGYDHYADNILFTCHGHKFALSLPRISNISLGYYQNDGAYVFKIKLFIHDKPSFYECIGMTYEENELKDILNKWFEGDNKK